MFVMAARRPEQLADGLLDKRGYWRQVLKHSDPHIQLCLHHCGVPPDNDPEHIHDFSRAMQIAWLWSTEVVRFLRVTGNEPILVWTMMEVFCSQGS